MTKNVGPLKKIFFWNFWLNNLHINKENEFQIFGGFGVFESEGGLICLKYHYMPLPSDKLDARQIQLAIR